MVGRHRAVSGESCPWGEAGRSQSLHSTAAVRAAGSTGNITRAEGREAGRWMRANRRQARDE
jgi:hypothetical protein